MANIVDSCLEVAPLFKVPTSFQYYDYLASVLDQLLDVVDSNRSLWDIIDIILDRIQTFDEDHSNFND